MTIFKTPMGIMIIALFSTFAASATDSYSPNVNRTYPMEVYWGDTHLHSSWSNDANYLGNKRLTPDYAYRFARGETVIAHNGMQARLRRPLDFLVLADHAEGLGLMSLLEVKDAALLETEAGQHFFKRLQAVNANSNPIEKEKARGKLSVELWTYNPEIGDSNRQMRESIWVRVASTADEYNQPGIFTAFTGFEWTSMPKGGNLHRVVIFADSADKTTTVLPFTLNDSENPEDLWDYMAQYHQKTGGDVLAIPHNGNLSLGQMFSPKDFSGNPLNLSYAKTRSRWEPLYEVTQVKGDGEAHPLLSPQDEFADFETWNDWGGIYGDGGKNQHKRSEYARAALKRGLQLQGKLDVNPFKFGMIGSTDAHNSLSTADDDSFWGKATSHEPNDKRLFTSMMGSTWPLPTWRFAASGYAAVWARENTRQSLFAAMKRKEVYASTGPRITVRFFGGWDYQTDDAFKPDLAKIGYKKGVPMGGDLSNAPKGEAPKFLIRAVKDPDGANLDRVQVIKGWHDADGELHEKIYNVALSDGRKENRNGKAKPVGSTVDIPDASYTNSIGDPELATVWQDPDFNKDELAFYYVRVLEIPTPRWTSYDVKFFGLKDIPEEVPMVTQERAYTSPIWYSPSE